MPALETIEKILPDGTAFEAGEIDRTLALAFRLLDAAEAFAAAFALSELGDLELPPTVGSEADQAQLRAAAPLYLASELEAARLLPAVEMLAGLFASGGLSTDLGPAATLLNAFWRARKDRFSQPERRAFFARLFGANSGPSLADSAGRNTAFEMRMIDLTEALYKLDEHPGFGSGAGPYEATRLRTAASQLAANLIPRSGGMTSFAARDILATTQEALTILKQASVQQAVGARSVWGAVRNLTERYLNEQVDISVHVTRGKSGVIVLAWLAEVLPQLHSYGGSFAPPDHPVIPAAAGWLQASLSLEEQNVAPTRPRA